MTVRFIVYRSDLGTADARPIVRWGFCPDVSLVYQAVEPGEVAADAPGFVPVVAGRGGIDPAAVVTNYYDPAASTFSVTAILGDTSPTADQQRRLRTELLYLCDWTELNDVAITWVARVGSAAATAKRDEWRAYRTALRDIPAQSGFPAAVTWPTAPNPATP